MMTTSLFSRLMLCAALFYMTSCASISGLQTAKVVGKGHAEMGLGLAGIGENPQNGEAVAVGAEAWGRMGISKRMDVGLKFSSTGTSVVDLKWQFIGNQNSLIAVATGVGVGVNGLAFSNTGAGVLDVHFPLYTSVHLGKKLDLYFNPRYISQTLAAGNQQGQIGYLGYSGGIMVGGKVKLLLDYSDFVFGNETQQFPIRQLTAGLKLRI
ncbi:MAG: hypothetical protein AAFR61_03860 [Bacteroidota bacterium]